jgi:putative sporulation protein YyaC
MIDKQKLFNFSYVVYSKIKALGKPVFLCVGSDKWVCDSFGPIVAEKLKHEYNIDAYVYGGLDYNVNANNLIEVVNYIETVHGDLPIILIDATLGDDVGSVQVKDGVFAGMGKVLPMRKIGALSILGVVGRAGRDFNLNSTRLQVVLELCQFVSLGCFLALSKFQEAKNDKSQQVLTNVDK